MDYCTAFQSQQRGDANTFWSAQFGETVLPPMHAVRMVANVPEDVTVCGLPYGPVDKDTSWADMAANTGADRCEECKSKTGIPPS